jgi:hypothetical protein
MRRLLLRVAVLSLRKLVMRNPPSEGQFFWLITEAIYQESCMHRSSSAYYLQNFANALVRHGNAITRFDLGVGLQSGAGF